MQTKSASQLKEELIDRSSRALKVVEGLETSDAWRIILEDQNENIRKIDLTWQFVPKSEEKRLDDLRIMKMASMTIVNLIQHYKSDIERCQEEIKRIEESFEGTEDGE